MALLDLQSLEIAESADEQAVGDLESVSSASLLLCQGSSVSLIQCF
ncbi:SapB/AmfS family lanthipeptide [Streptomyces sp. NPDC059477]